MNNVTSTPAWELILKQAGVSVSSRRSSQTNEVFYPFTITYNRYRTIANIYAITERDIREGFANGVIVDEETLKTFIDQVHYSFPLCYAHTCVCMCSNNLMHYRTCVALPRRIHNLHVFVWQFNLFRHHPIVSYASQTSSLYILIFVHPCKHLHLHKLHACIHICVCVQRSKHYRDQATINPNITVARGTQIDLLEFLTGTHVSNEDRQGPKKHIFEKLASITQSDWSHLNELHFLYGWPIEGLLSVPKAKDVSAKMLEAAEKDWNKRYPGGNKPSLYGYDEQGCKVCCVHTCFCLLIVCTCCASVVHLTTSSPSHAHDVALHINTHIYRCFPGCPCVAYAWLLHCIACT